MGGGRGGKGKGAPPEQEPADDAEGDDGEVDAGGPEQLPDDVRMETFAVHVTKEDQPVHLDFYTPADPARASGASVLFTHGSKFRAGEKLRRLPHYLVPLTQHGYSIAVVEHRGVAAGFPGLLHDGKAALRFLRGNAPFMGLDPDRISVMGYSSGGWMSTMLAATAASDPSEGMNGRLGIPAFRDVPVHLACCIDFYGATKLQNYPKACPEVHVTAGMPPIFVVHGTEDPCVPCDRSRKLVERLKEVGAKHDFIEIPEAGHGGPQFHTDEIIQKVLSWLDKHSGPK
mmetsp:Transcript_24774/g.45429  ORF Transcript_24774/g.45429 Transcript_24774/m.45429 type:complete len:286 (-) Transcript_24774:22-879(-)